MPPSNSAPPPLPVFPIPLPRYVEAKDNVKFLTTLERHFKNISSGNLTAILDTLPSMMNALRMVWVISRHYNTDDQMLPLMKRIAGEIADKVPRVLEAPTSLCGGGGGCGVGGGACVWVLVCCRVCVHVRSGGAGEDNVDTGSYAAPTPAPQRHYSMRTHCHPLPCNGA
jgi:hypothetical protein